MPITTRIDRTEFASLNADGWTITELAEHFQCNRSTVSRIRRALGISPDTRRFMTAERRTIIEGMLADGWSFAEIHRTEGAHPDTLRKHFPGRAWTRDEHAAHQSTIRTLHDWDGKHHPLRRAA